MIMISRMLAGGAAVALAVVLGGSAMAADLKSYNSQSKEFWKNPPPDWFLGDETPDQRGQAPVAHPPTGLDQAQIETNLKKVKLPPGFKIEIYAAGMNSARQMAWGPKGTLFAGAFGVGNVYAVTDKGGKKEVKVVIKGLRMPTGIAMHQGTLYVADIDKILAYPNAEDTLDNMPE